MQHPARLGFVCLAGWMLAWLSSDNIRVTERAPPAAADHRYGFFGHATTHADTAAGALYRHWFST